MLVCEGNTCCGGDGGGQVDAVPIYSNIVGLHGYFEDLSELLPIPTINISIGCDSECQPGSVFVFAGTLGMGDDGGCPSEAVTVFAGNAGTFGDV